MKAYGETEGNFAAAFAYVPPDRGRIELSTPLTGTLLVVTARGDNVLLYYPGDNLAIVATGSDDAFAILPDGSGGFYVDDEKGVVTITTTGATLYIVPPPAGGTVFIFK